MLKTFRADARDERSKREIEMASRIQSPRIPRVIDHGELNLDGGRVLWLKEERLPGASLRHVSAAEPLSEAAIRVVCDHVLEALEGAERLRVVHRDVKPENIILSPDARSAWLIDFGIARELDRESITGTDSLFGPCTFGYASPEQIHNRKAEIDSRSDLFSLAVTLFELSEGFNPLVKDASGPLEIADRTQHYPLPRITRLTDPRFVDLVEAMSRSRRDHRPSSVAEARQWFREMDK